MFVFSDVRSLTFDIWYSIFGVRCLMLIIFHIRCPMSGIRYAMLGAGRSMLMSFARCRMLTYSIFDARRLMLDARVVRCSIFDFWCLMPMLFHARYAMLDVRCSYCSMFDIWCSILMFDNRYSMFDVWCLMLDAHFVRCSMGNVRFFLMFVWLVPIRWPFWTRARGRAAWAPPSRPSLQKGCTTSSMHRCVSIERTLYIS